MSVYYRTAALIVTTTGFFVVAFFFSMVMNRLVHAFFPPNLADYINDGVSAIQILLILFGTGFMAAIHRRY